MSDIPNLLENKREIRKTELAIISKGCSTASFAIGYFQSLAATARPTHGQNAKIAHIL